MSAKNKVAELVKEAREEDAREGSKFDAAGFANFFPEENKTDPEAVEQAWRVYENEVYGQ